MALNFSTPSIFDAVPQVPYGDKVPDQMPKRWFIVFHEVTSRPWLRWLACGRFKHVSCFGWVDSAQRWVFFDPALERTWLRLVPDDVASEEPAHVFDIKAGYYGGDLGHYANLGQVVALDIQLDNVMRPNIGIGWGCVRDVARVVGIRTRAIRPDAFFRECLKRGGTVVAGRGMRHETP